MVSQKGIEGNESWKLDRGGSLDSQAMQLWFVAH